MIRRHCIPAGVLLLLALSRLLSGAASTPHHAIENLNKLPLAFERNQGQVRPKVDYVARGSGYSVYLAQGNARIALQRPKTFHAPVLDLQLVGARRAVEAYVRQPLPGKVNYFLGNDPARWREDIPTFGRVEYRNVYPGIDLAYYGNQGRLEYDFIVAPAADPGGIRIAVAGARKVRVDAAGNLVLETEDGEVQFHKPETYQEIAGVRKTIESRYLLDGANEVRFSLGTYARSQALVIDPALVYSTYLGGSGGDHGVAIAVGPQGNPFVTGYTSSADFPTVNPEQSYYTGSSAIFVSELTTDGSGLIYSTYFGGSLGDHAYSIAVDSGGHAYIVGSTNSYDFPLKNALYPILYGGQGFVTKLSPAGNELAYSTYLGGTGSDYATGVAADSAGNAYVTGLTFSSDFPVTPGAYQTSPPDQFGGSFVTKLNSSGSALVWSTYFGQVGRVSAQAIAVDSSDAIYLTGYAQAGLPVTPGSPQAVYGGGVDAFIAKLNKTGSALTYCTYLGGSQDDYGTSIAVDSGGNAHVAGYTSSTDLPVTPSVLQPTIAGAENAFVAKLNNPGTAWKYVTYLGGQREDYAHGIAVDSSDEAIVAGVTYSTGFPRKAALQPTFAGVGTALFKTTTSGSSWHSSDTSVRGIVDAIAINPGSNGSLLAGTSDNGVFQSSDGGAHWTPTNLAGVGISAVAFPPVPATAGNRAYAGTVFQALYASSDNGATWTYSGTAPVPIYAIAVDPTTPTTLYVASAYANYPTGAAKSTDGGATWVSLALPDAPVYALAIDPTSPNIVYAGSYFGLYKSMDAGQTWAALNVDNTVGAVPSVALNPSQPSAVYAVALGIVYKSTDGGTSWAPMPTGLPAVRSLTVAPSKPSVLYAATESGVYLISNGGVSWAPAGLTMATVSEIAVDPQRAAVAYAVNAALGYDGFVAKINPLGAKLIYSTYLGGTGLTYASGVATNSSGDALVTGYALAPDFPSTPGAFQPATGSNRAAGFVTRLTGTTPSCTYTASPKSYIFYAAGGSANFSVVSPGGCAWTPTPSAPWITVASGVGPGVAPLAISVAPNKGAARRGTIAVGTSTITVTQAAAGCSYSLSTDSLTFPQSGGTASIDVTANHGCAWNVTGLPLWLTVTSGAGGNGNGTVTFQAAPNPFAGHRTTYDTVSVAQSYVSADEAGTGAAAAKP